MPKKKRDEKPQSERFKEFAREVGADTDEDALDRAFRKVVRPADSK
ncbi:MAG: hypothetical protein PVI23_13080 [Maricaulaceae bacterium]|jgi:hypothetical protein